MKAIKVVVVKGFSANPKNDKAVKRATESKAVAISDCQGKLRDDGKVEWALDIDMPESTKEWMEVLGNDKTCWALQAFLCGIRGPQDAVNIALKGRKPPQKVGAARLRESSPDKSYSPGERTSDLLSAGLRRFRNGEITADEFAAVLRGYEKK